MAGEHRAVLPCWCRMHLFSRGLCRLALPLHSVLKIRRDAPGNLATSADPGVPPLPQHPPLTCPIAPVRSRRERHLDRRLLRQRLDALSSTPPPSSPPPPDAPLLRRVDDYASHVPAAPSLDSCPPHGRRLIKTTHRLHGGRQQVTSPPPLNGYQIFTQRRQPLRLYFHSDAADYVLDCTSCTLATPGYNDGLCHHVALVVAPPGVSLYVDGGPEGGAQLDRNLAPATNEPQASPSGRYPACASP